MKFIFKKIFIIATIFSVLFIFTGCENQGSAEKAGKKLDQTVDSIKKQIDDAKK